MPPVPRDSGGVSVFHFTVPLIERLLAIIITHKVIETNK